MASPLLINTLTHQSPRSVASPTKMSITQAYFLAHKARSKLSSEAGRPDHNLRLLVGHANLLDSLMLDLAEAEREQESWFNQSVRGAAPSKPQQDKHIQWADAAVIEEPSNDWHAEDADDSDDSDSDYSDDEDVEMADVVSLRRIPSHSAPKPDLGYLMDEDDFSSDSDDDEDFAELALQRSPSHSSTLSPPELDHDSDTSEDESMPPSPPTVVLPTFSDKKPTETTTAQDKDAFYSEGYYLPPRNPARLVVSAY
ncbi:hypothetical protein B0T18DRAFT_385244 [Schizothecium vesticola]|uniref:Protein ECM13 n=1 Tax=Schizothecium vesticola TaxID=314040 RepID=A0AA40F8F4_9PEZI|nr:hypothetical protein B0T18DRAFT_385244 [Schizothecium vesticola]